MTRQSAWALITHFIYDIFHFDGKFFDTLRYLLFKPGKVPAEYVTGKRLTYLDPIRMYLFTSAVFFLIFFSLSNASDFNTVDWGKVLSKTERAEVAMDLNARLKAGTRDTVIQNAMDLLLDSTQIVSMIKGEPSDSVPLLRYKGELYRVEGDTIELDLEDDEIKKAGWLKKKFLERLKVAKEKYGDDPGEGVRRLLDSFIHRMPYMLFISLPFFALILKLLYIRKKRFFYSDHIVFTLYHYIFSFILFLLMFGTDKLNDWLDWGILGLLMFCLFVWGGIYLYKGMRRFYGDSRGKTIAKFLLLNLLGLISLLILLTIFFLFTAYQL
ncbi:MAG TPA: DUF3667 domain-containing protein [Flavisolibacter sp.]|nr:DUF3667 domain-containing protein [Flavisolibacter sp.]